jgi:hypothetical protein
VHTFGSVMVVVLTIVSGNEGSVQNYDVVLQGCMKLEKDSVRMNHFVQLLALGMDLNTDDAFSASQGMLDASSLMTNRLTPEQE